MVIGGMIKRTATRYENPLVSISIGEVKQY